jgi:hypothetical protein
MAIAVSVRFLKEASVHQYKLGPHDIIVHDRDLSQATRAAFRLLGEERKESRRQKAEGGEEGRWEGGKLGRWEGRRWGKRRVGRWNGFPKFTILHRVV